MTRRDSGGSLLLSLPDEALAHLAVALGMYRKNAVMQGARVPSELRELELWASERAMRGQQRTAIGDSPRSGNTQPVQGKLATYGQVAALLGCSVRTIKRRVASGALPAVRDGGLARIRMTDLDRFIDDIGA